MQLQFNCDVLERTDEKVGALEHIVLNRETLEVVYLVVQPAEMEMDEVLVPFGSVEWADDMIVQLAIGKEAFEGLKPFETYYNVAPPPETEPPEEPGVPLVPAEPPVGAATGIESIAYTPILEENINISASDVVVDYTTVAYATDGEVGKLKRVDANDETKRVMAFVVEADRIVEHDLDVPIDVVSNITQEAITLSARKSDLQ